MTEKQKLDMLNQMVGGEEDEGVLSVYLKLAEDKILNRMYPYKEDYSDVKLPERFFSIQLNISAYLLNKRGAEGEIQHIENGIHRNYGSSDVPDVLLKDVMPFCQVIK